MDDERKSVLKRLVTLSAPVDASIRELARFPLDSEKELITLRDEHLVSVLRRFVLGDLTSCDVERWADALECRDDVQVESDQVKRDVFVLASPTLEGALTIQRAREIVARYGATV